MKYYLAFWNTITAPGFEKLSKLKLELFEHSLMSSWRRIFTIHKRFHLEATEIFNCGEHMIVFVAFVLL